MLILLLLYFASHSWAKGLWDSVKNYFVDDFPRDSNYTLRYAPSCPDAGYFFQQDPAHNSLVADCYLCFCQGRNTAVCWLRENKKCDIQHYKHNNSVTPKETRVKRSPLGFGDIFFKDAARSVFNKAEPEVCKPFESSFSEGCPPADWCTGCTVCDCDADGHWDCHILSFCDDEKDKGKKQGKKGNVPLKYPKSRKSSKHRKTTIVTSTRKPSRTKTTTKRPPYKRGQQGPSKGIRQRSVIQNGKSVKPLIIKKNEKNPKVVKSSPSKKVLNGSETELSEQVIKGVMAAMEKMWTKQVTAALPDIVNMIQKRSEGNHSQNKKVNTAVKYKKMSPAKMSSKTHTYNRSLFVRKQKRQEQKKELQRRRDRQKKEALAAINAAKKPVPKAINRNNKPINRANNRSTKKPTKPTNRQTTTNRQITDRPKGKTNNKYNKANNNLNNIRRKRQVNFSNQTDSLSSYNISGITLNSTANVQHATEQEIITESPTFTNLIDKTATTNTLYTNTNYYAYSVPDVTTEDSGFKNVTHYNDTEVDIVIKKLDNDTNFGQILGKDKLNLANEIPNEVANDIKITKWSEIKMFQVKENATNKKLNKTDEFKNELINKINETKASPMEDHRKQILLRDVKRKVDRITKKYSLLRMVNTKNCKTKRGSEINLDNYSGPSLSSKIENLRNVLKRLLGGFRGKNSSALVNKRKKANAIKYLKKFFNNIFFKDSNKTSINQRMRNNNHTIQMLCESFGPCVVNIRNKEILMTKIKELNNETVQILKSLRIIKGLLRLIDIPYDPLSFNKTSNFKRDIHKLNIILKKSFDDDNYREELSETQITQINYIKQNTKVFTRSVAKFTKILNEIIDLISVKSNNGNRRQWSVGTKSKLPKYNITKVESVNKFKRLLHNYNIVHNAFISKMIDMFTKLQSNHHDVTLINNKTVDGNGAEYYSKKVMNNLNKLKNLATALNPMRRQKRHAVRQDNAVEYLLMLMEYMFQQNQLDNSPVNDGIDLLIEAIKNAPDIKSVKKKVLKNNHPRTNDMKIAEAVTNKNVSYEESISDNKISNEDSNLNKISNEDSKSILNTNDNSSSIDQGESIDDENESDMQLLKIINTRTENEQEKIKTKITNEQVNKKPKNDAQKAVDYETATDMPTKVYIAEDDALNDFDSRLEKASGELSKRTEAYISELDEENNVEESLGVIKAATVINEEVTEIPIVTKTYTAVSHSQITATKTAKSNTITKEVKPKLTEKKELKSLEWIDDERRDNSESGLVINSTLDQGPRKLPKVKNKTVASTISQASTKVEKPAQIFEIDISDASKEDSEEKSKVKIKKAEDVMIKKEQDLLNSLDYGTEASIVEDSEPKDGVEEKFLSDYFAE